MPSSEPKTSEPKKLPGIFISYRRSDNPDAVGRIYDRLVSEFGKARVFKDVDSIPLGQDFRGHLNDIVGGCAAVLAIIGPKWADIRNEAGQKRLEDPDDFVRIELEAALARDVPVVPVLVGHAAMPGTSLLPSTLSSLAFRQSIEVRPDPDFHNDATRLVAALKAILDPTAALAPPSVIDATRSGRWLPWVTALAIAAALGMIAMAVPTLRYLRQTPPLEMRTEIAAPATDITWAFALSPDGRQIAYSAKIDGVSRLWLRALDSTTAQPLPGTEDATNLFWSPDSRSIGFFAAGALRRLDLNGGQAQTLAPAAGTTSSGTWSSNGVILFSQGTGPLLCIAATGGVVTEATKVSALVVQTSSPLFLPGGDRFLFTSYGGTAPGIYMGALDGRAPIRLTQDTGLAGYFSSGWMLWTAATGTLVAQRLDMEKAVLTGQLHKVADGVGPTSVAPAGLLAYRTTAALRRSGQTQWVDRSGDVLGAVGEPNDWVVASPRVSPDGRRVALARSTTGASSNIYLMEASRSSRLTFGTSFDVFPVWSPDSERIVYASEQPDGHGGLYQKLASGAGADEQLATHGTLDVPSSWSADGRFLLYTGSDSKTGGDLWVLPMMGDRKPFVFLKTAFDEAWGVFSPDGRWMAYQSNASGGRSEVFIRAFIPHDSADTEAGEGGGQWQVSTEGGAFPTWRPDGKEIYYVNPAGGMMAAQIKITGSTVETGTPILLFKTRIMVGGIDTGQGRQYDVAPDGRFLIYSELDSKDIQPIYLIQNWNPAGK